MEPSTALERTYRVKQSEIQEAAGLATAAKGFSLDLEGGGVVANWSRDGRSVDTLLRVGWLVRSVKTSSFPRPFSYLAMATRTGHTSTMNFQASKLQSEIHLNETVRDITSVKPLPALLEGVR